MAVWMCDKCWNIYRQELLVPNIVDGELKFNCPNAKCDCHELFEIDELMARPIQVLNRKGYRTAFCCSGHSYSEYNISFVLPYILFAKVYYFPNLPKKWTMKVTTLVKGMGEKAVTDLYVPNCRDKYIYMRNLEQWIDKLPSYKDGTYEVARVYRKRGKDATFVMIRNDDVSARGSGGKIESSSFS